MKLKMYSSTLVLIASMLVTTSVKAGPELLLIEPILGVLGSIFGSGQGNKTDPKIPEGKKRSLSAASSLPLCSEGQENNCIKQIGNEIGPIKDSVFHGVAVGFGGGDMPIFASLYENGRFIRFTDIPAEGVSLNLRSEHANLKPESSNNFPACQKGQITDCIKRYGNEIGPISESLFHGIVVKVDAKGQEISASVYNRGKFVRSTGIPPLGPGFANAKNMTLASAQNATSKANEALSIQQPENNKMAQSNLPECQGDRRAWTDCFGSVTYQDGSQYIGEFKVGKRDGRGTYTEVTGPWKGSKYIGQWRDDKRHGEGIDYYGANTTSGFWENGRFIGSSKVAPASTAEGQPQNTGGANDERFSELDRLRTAAEQAKREKAELEAQLAVAQQQAQVKPTVSVNTQGKRVALVIGNAKYRFSPLNNPVNDATDMAASLRSVGFDVIEVKDATLKQMREATRRFADKLEVSDVGLVYYSGHGIEVKGKNYLIPVNADIRREYEVVDQAFDASNLLRMMESLQSGTKKRVNILIVDACRNNDLPKSWRSTNSGLARMDAPAGSFISFATAPGQVASDGQGRNSPYTKHLLNALKQPNVPIEQVFKQVRRNVMDETGGEQVPWENSSLVGDFYFTVAR